MEKKLSLQVMVEIALLAALAFVIDLFIPSIKPIPSVYLNFSMIPIFILAFRRGVIPSAIAGMIWGLLQIITGEAWILHPIQVIMEYIIALAFIGVAGLFKNRIQKEVIADKKSGLIITVIAILAGSLSRYFWHFLAGYFFWVDILKIPEEKGFFFSFWTNGLSGIGSGIFCAVIIGLLLTTSPRMIKQSL
ncbi:energy-coupled thiamine transporter ThiT [Fervidibacillus halotolerans]|uniref:Energy-coupled thiamine transporter ThiT n=1 Tax=Fervidibacillus halotolerans TaxID=2980027 RepID=A0A9E8M220_9BACI|nr:energy-coupled thiamine transporter ThiT [Fervidibacillus halotolerans]WAA13475.1 energy-coupled thiamine transporter ThiT [Fervidibacillus halotolerans]